MSPEIQVTCSCALTFGVPILLAGWDLWRMRPSQNRLPPGDDGLPEPTLGPQSGVLPRVQKPLPDCLIPKRIPEKVRELA